MYKPVLIELHLFSGAANTDSSKSPRGIRGFALDGNTFGEWKVQGKVGGYKK
jgi:hypothetical protein